MYSLTSANRYYLYLGFVRMNLGIDGLFKIIRSQMKELSPISGDVFLFFGKNRQSVKILRWDGDGFPHVRADSSVGSICCPSAHLI